MIRKTVVLFTLAVIIGLAAWKLSEPWRVSQARHQELLLTSDAGDVGRTVTVWGDDWLGYLIFKSRAMQEALRRQHIGLKYEMVFDFKQRVQGLADGRCDFLAITADSYISNGKDTNYPGVVIFLIDESYGGDAIIGGPKVNNLDALNTPGIKGAFVGNSPSEFLLKSSQAHFHLDNLNGKMKSFQRDKEEDVYNALADGSVDFAVLWEPFTSRALHEIAGAKRLLDTSQAQGLILDITVASRSVIAREPAVADAVTRAYFLALHHYLNHPSEMRDLAVAYSGQPEAVTDQMLKGIRFVSLGENQNNWFGTDSSGTARITDSLQAISDILVKSGDFSSDPLDGNPYVILNSRVLAGLSTFPELESVDVASTQASFPQLTDEQWDKLPVTGTLLDEPINFPSGQFTLDDDSKELLREAARRLTYYPEQRVKVTAQVSPGSDPESDQALSNERAQSVAEFLVSCGVDSNRIHAEGLGSTNLPPRRLDESDAVWKRLCRHARVYLIEDKSQ